MWLYWYKDSDIGQNIREVIKRLDITATYQYFSSDYPCGALQLPSKHLYGMSPNKESIYPLVITRDQIYKALFLVSLGLSEEEIKSIIGDTHVD